MICRSGRRSARWTANTIAPAPSQTAPAILAPAGGGTDVTESFRLNPSPFNSVYWVFGGFLRKRRNVRDMTKTLNRIKDVVEA